MRFFVATLLAALLLVLPSAAGAEGTIQSELARTGLWANTTSSTPPVYLSGTSPCWANVKLRSPNSGNVTPNLATRFQHVPLPCFYHSDPGSDSEGIVRNQTASGWDYYEFWTMGWGRYGVPNAWSAGWGGAANNDEMIEAGGVRVWPGYIGVQGSGIAFIPGLPLQSEMAHGVVPHMVQIEVPISCAYWKAPAIRTDSVSTTNDPNCIPLGQTWRLPADTDCSNRTRPAAQMLCVAARDYGVIATDQTHDKVTIRFEGVQSGKPNVYWQVGGYFGCDGMFHGAPVSTSQEFDCYPTESGAFWSSKFNGSFLRRLVPVN